MRFPRPLYLDVMKNLQYMVNSLNRDVFRLSNEVSRREGFNREIQEMFEREIWKRRHSLRRLDSSMGEMNMERFEKEIKIQLKEIKMLSREIEHFCEKEIKKRACFFRLFLFVCSIGLLFSLIIFFK